MSHGSDDSVPRLGIETLARMIGVSASRVRRWIAFELIQPCNPCDGRVFDWEQLQAAKLLAELSSRGVTLKRIKQQIAMLRQLADSQNAPSAAIGYGATLFIRDHDGNPVELSGQRNFDFNLETPSIVGLPEKDRVDEYFWQALQREDEGRFAEAAELYEQALELEPYDADLHFNLANVFFELGDTARAVDHYQTALVCDPDHSDALNNLEIAIEDR